MRALRRGEGHSRPRAKKHKFEIADLLAGMVDGMTSTEEERVGHVQCPRCGLLYSAFKETGRLGCAECYTAFQFQLRPLLRRIHGDTRHRGKVPTRDGEGLSRTRQIQRLHDELAARGRARGVRARRRHPRRDPAARARGRGAPNRRQSEAT